MKKFGIVVVAIALIGFGVFLSPKLTSAVSFFSGGEEHFNATTITNSFSEVAELSVEEYHFTDVGKFSEDNMTLVDLDSEIADNSLTIAGIEIPFTGKSFLMTYSGVCKAGIDFNEVTTEIDDNSKQVIINTPAVEILDTSIDLASAQVYDQSFNPFNQIEVNEVISTLASAEDKAQKDAVSLGILTRAQARVEELLTTHTRNMLLNTEYSEYEIVIVWEENPLAEATASTTPDVTATDEATAISSDTE